jgi:hypothetical protein
MEARAGAALDIRYADLPLGETGNARDAIETLADAAIGIVGARHLERSAPGADAVDAWRGAAACRAVSTLRAQWPTCGAGAVVAVAGAALGRIGAR